MFILKRQDVDIKNIQHPSKEQQIPILTYQGQTFRLLSVFSAAQEDDARSLWRDLTDNKGKACVLLEEPERFSIWGKVRLDQLQLDDDAGGDGAAAVNNILVQACLLILQGLYIDVEDLLGAKQSKQFEKDIATVFSQWKFAQANSDKAIQGLLTVDPLAMPQIPPWSEHQLYRLLEEMHRMGKDYFGNANFTSRALEALEDLGGNQKQVLQWLQQSPAGKLWV